MPKRLILIRHAKSDWGDLNQPDKARNLNERGRRQAPLLGRWLRKNGYVPDVVLCSAAVRTRETLDLLALDTTVIYEDSLYLATPDVMFRELSKREEGCIAMIGHNPGIGELAYALAAEPAAHPKFHAYPTLATTVLNFDQDRWRDIEKGTVTDFAVPKDLE
ncbi:histidine phosphatase family protein [Marivivens donghaensis]|uniref:Histidine phosphatase family protein n=1 Tax=Marivivens donghaensis TaxID=1699413 RepID=A0ABX0VV35_9RHOB|nr:histidine phosphatase family protein [Marivivens donghaensis]NIY71801.1 histidine phosphatase family protein [Marivivens donghaensis]